MIRQRKRAVNRVTAPWSDLLERLAERMAEIIGWGGAPILSAFG
jgi:hypothetical protein